MWFTMSSCNQEVPNVFRLNISSSTNGNLAFHHLLALQPPFITCVMAVGLRASNSRNTSVWPESIRLGTRQVVTVTRSVTVMENYFYLWAGSRTSHTERWWALSSRYSLLLACWPFGFPITLTWHRSRFYLNMAILVK